MCIKIKLEIGSLRINVFLKRGSASGVLMKPTHSVRVTGELSLGMRITKANAILDKIDKGMLSEGLPSQR